MPHPGKFPDCVACLGRAPSPKNQKHRGPGDGGRADYGAENAAAGGHLSNLSMLTEIMERLRGDLFHNITRFPRAFFEVKV